MSVWEQRRKEREQQQQQVNQQVQQFSAPVRAAPVQIQVQSPSQDDQTNALGISVVSKSNINRNQNMVQEADNQIPQQQQPIANYQEQEQKYSQPQLQTQQNDQIHVLKQQQIQQRDEPIQQQPQKFDKQPENPFQAKNEIGRDVDSKRQQELNRMQSKQNEGLQFNSFQPKSGNYQKQNYMPGQKQYEVNTAAVEQDQQQQQNALNIDDDQSQPTSKKNKFSPQKNFKNMSDAEYEQYQNQKIRERWPRLINSYLRDPKISGIEKNEVKDLIRDSNEFRKMFEDSKAIYDQEQAKINEKQKIKDEQDQKIKDQLKKEDDEKRKEKLHQNQKIQIEEQNDHNQMNQNQNRQQVQQFEQPQVTIVNNQQDTEYGYQPTQIRNDQMYQQIDRQSVKSRQMVELQDMRGEIQLLRQKVQYYEQMHFDDMRRIDQLQQDMELERGHRITAEQQVRNAYSDMQTYRQEIEKYQQSLQRGQSYKPNLPPVPISQGRPVSGTGTSAKQVIRESNNMSRRDQQFQLPQPLQQINQPYINQVLNNAQQDANYDKPPSRQENQYQQQQYQNDNMQNAAEQQKQFNPIDNILNNAKNLVDNYAVSDQTLQRGMKFDPKQLQQQQQQQQQLNQQQNNTNMAMSQPNNTINAQLSLIQAKTPGAQVVPASIKPALQNTTQPKLVMEMIKNQNSLPSQGTVQQKALSSLLIKNQDVDKINPEQELEQLLQDDPNYNTVEISKPPNEVPASLFQGLYDPGSLQLPNSKLPEQGGEEKK